MRKIISIVLTLGIILGLTAFAAPVAAIDCPDDCTPIDIADLLGPPDFCAGGTSDYLIGDLVGVPITLPVTLIPGTDKLSVDFPAGTDLTSVLPANVIVRDGVTTASPTAITKTGTHLEFVIPIAFFATGMPAGTTIEIEVQGVVNPTTEGDACLFVDYAFACCGPVQFDCVEYTISPAIHTLGFHFDYDDTYPGIALDFIPPFKACGQVGYGTELVVGQWFNDFDLILDADVLGCAPPCASATMWFVVTACEPGGVISFQFNGGGVNTYTVLDIGDVQSLPAVALPAFPWVPIVWPNEIHFSTPGDYEICFYLQCPAVPCLAGPQIVAEICMPVKVYQWKEAEKIDLFRKWNLISLPLVPLEDPNPIEDVWAAYLYEAEVVSVHYYDQCADSWSVYGPGQTSLATMEDGKSYWVKIAYDFATKLPGDPMDGLWVWGNQRPVPPDAPAAYPVCTGWNMVGFTGLTPQLDSAYLWNWWDTFFTFADYGAVYGWDATSQAWWSFLPGLGVFPTLQIGEGYWISFEHDGMIYPP